MSIRNHLMFWFFISILFMALLWALKSVLVPFVLGIAIAYLLNPIVNRLGKFGLPRALSAICILVLFFLSVLSVLLIVGPILYKELLQFSAEVPDYFQKMQLKLSEHISHIKLLQEKFGSASQGNIQNFIQENIGSAVNVIQFILEKIASGSKAILGWFALLFLVPIVSFFMMQDWPKITQWVEGLIPRDSHKVITGLLKKIDLKIAGFVRGQLSVMVIIAVVYAVALSLAGLKYGFLLGVSAGVLSIIPLVGSVVGLFLSTGVAWFQSADMSFVALIASIFIVGQFIEGNFLTPKLVGDSVGLHPLWVIFALMAGGSLFGITGMLLAVPVLASIGVLASYGLDEYKKSIYYTSSKKGVVSKAGTLKKTKVKTKSRSKASIKTKLKPKPKSQPQAKKKQKALPKTKGKIRTKKK